MVLPILVIRDWDWGWGWKMGIESIRWLGGYINIPTYTLYLIPTTLYLTELDIVVP